MFPIFCKSVNILKHHRRARHSLFSCLQNPSSFTGTRVRFIYSSCDNPNGHSLAASYLITNCGFSPQSARSASKHVKFETLDQPDTVIAMFKRYGSSEADVLKLIKKDPKVLLSKPEKLLPKLEFFHSKGMSDIARVIPEILRRSLEKRIIPNFKILSDLLQSDDKAISAVKRYIPILYLNPETYLKPSINVLRENGVPKSNISLLLLSWPRCIAVRPIRMKKFVETANEMGFDPSSVYFVKALTVFSQLSKSTWERKVGIYKSWGWSEEEILVAFRKEPFSMTASEKKIMAVMDFLVNKMDYESSYVAKNPYLITRSLKKRIIPRASILQFLLSKQLIYRKPSLVSVLIYSEKVFLQKFVNRFDEAPELLQLYTEKLNL